MTPLRYAANETPVPESTLARLFFEAIDAHGDAPALQFLVREGVLEDISYREVNQLVRRVGAGLEAHGVTRGDRAAILSENRPEWAIVDYGCLCAGVVDVPVYSTLTAPQVAYVFADSGVKLVFVSDAEQMVKAVAAARNCPQDIQVVIFDEVAGAPDGVIAWKDFLETGEQRSVSWSDDEFRSRGLQAEPGDVATILYTSGTTGDPKGVMLTHRNVSSNVLASNTGLDIGKADNTVSFLPLSHILQRMVDYLFFWRGTRIGYARSLATLIADMKVIRPTVVVSVPRTYEKIYNGVMQAAGLKRSIIEWACGVADRVADLRLAGGDATGVLALQYALADALVFRKVKNAVGGRLRLFVSGGGPLSPELNRFFYSIGMTILEGYGLTETSPVTNVNSIEHFRIGTVGKVLPQTEVKIADDGEIFVRGPQVMKGYYNKPEATAAAIDSEGWFGTGDIGEIDDDGFLRITDRKKDLIVTAGGKNVAPQPIENRLKTNPFVEQAIMLGDRLKFCSLLVVPAFPALEKWAAGKGIATDDPAALIRHPDVVALMEAQVFEMLTDLASFEKPKKIALLPEELTIENGFLTPTMKIKRRVVQERFADLISELYSEDPSDHEA